MLFLLAAAAAGCGKEEEPETQIQEEALTEPEPEELPEESEPAKPEEPEEEGFSFKDVEDREFYFSSGAGGWYTVCYIHEDGTFDGHYQDSNMGDSAPEYPNGTVYYSEFSGSFTEPVKVDDTTWSFKLASIEYPFDKGEEIKEGFRYIYTDAYGLTEAEEFLMYLPGAKLAELPEAYRSWVGYYDLESTAETELPFYGLYNVNREEGFSSYVNNPYEQIQAVLLETEEQGVALEAILMGASSQGDMNVAAGEIYQLWDNALNEVWRILKANMDEEDFEPLLEEQRVWIAEKESEMEAAGAEAEGGTMYAMLVADKGAELTKARVYELAEYMK